MIRSIFTFLFLATGFIYSLAQQVQIDGHAKLMMVDKMNGADSVVVRLPDGTLAVREAWTLVDPDANPFNEIQSLSLEGNALTLSQGGGVVDLTSTGSPWSNTGPDLYYNLGKIGIGTVNPVSPFHILTNSTIGTGHIKLTQQGFGASRIVMNNTTNTSFWDISGGTGLSPSDAHWYLHYNETGDIMTVRGDGRIGVNDTNPIYCMEINGKGLTRVLNIYNTIPTTTGTTYNYGIRCNMAQANNTGFPRLYNFYGITTDNDSYLSYGVYGYASGASQNNYGVYAYAPIGSGYAGYFNGDIYCTGSYLPSDPKLKTNIKRFEQGLEKIAGINPITYHYKPDALPESNFNDKLQIGLDAEELEVVLPSLVNETFQPHENPEADTDEAQGEWFKAVNYQGLVPVLVQAIKEQQEIIDQLELRLNTLEKEIAELK